MNDNQTQQKTTVIKLLPQPRHTETCRHFHQRLLYSRKDAAFQLSVSVRSLDYLISEGRLNYRQIGGRKLIAHDELLRFARHDRRDLIVPGPGVIQAAA